MTLASSVFDPPVRAVGGAHRRPVHLRGALMRKTLLATVLAITTAGAITLAGAPANAAPTANDAGTLVSSVEGTFTDVDGSAGTVTGEFTPSKFEAQGDQLVATG